MVAADVEVGPSANVTTAPVLSVRKTYFDPSVRSCSVGGCAKLIAYNMLNVVVEQWFAFAFELSIH